MDKPQKTDGLMNVRPMGVIDINNFINGIKLYFIKYL